MEEPLEGNPKELLDAEGKVERRRVLVSSNGIDGRAIPPMILAVWPLPLHCAAKRIIAAGAATEPGASYERH